MSFVAKYMTHLTVVGAVLALIAAYWFVSVGFGGDVRYELSASHPSRWEERDVSAWLNSTVHYPEYAAAFEKHGIDGPTLFYLTEADFEFIGVKHPVHRAKLVAHLDLLRGQCICTPPARPDFWAHLSSGPARVLRLVAMFEFAPRLSLGYAMLVESQLLWDVLGHFGAEAYPTTVFCVAVLLFLAAPHAALVLFGLVVAMPHNPMVAIAYILSHCGKQVVDAAELRTLLPGLLQRRDSLQQWWNFLFNVSPSRSAWIKEVLYPLVAIALSPFLPYYVTLAAAYGYMLFYLLQYVVFFVEQGHAMMKGQQQEESTTATS